MRARAAVSHAFYEAPAVREIELHGPEADEVLVRIEHCGICHSDLGLGGGQRFPTGVILGHEAAGVVEETGPLARSLAPGDHVILSFQPDCGHCFYCARGWPTQCIAPRSADTSRRNSGS